jgi:hypothetical protein
MSVLSTSNRVLASALAVALVIANQAAADCPPDSSQFEELARLRPAECGEFLTVQDLKKSAAFSDSRTIFFSEIGQKVEFSTAYTLRAGRMSAVATIKGALVQATPPDDERGPYAILDDETGRTAYLFGRDRDYQLSLQQEHAPRAREWAPLDKRIGIARAKASWQISGVADPWISEADSKMRYAFLGSVYCGDFDFAVELPGIDRIALISGARWMLVNNGSSFRVDDTFTPNEGFSTWSRRPSALEDTREFSDKRTIGSVAASGDGAVLWVRVKDSSEGTKADVRYIKFVRSASDFLTWSIYRPSWWCFW